jgi:hypothetical protein
VASQNKFKRSEDVIHWQVKQLIEGANKDNLISLDESVQYLDLINWDENNLSFVEIDILKKVENWEYKKFKDAAPNVLHHIEFWFKDWYDLILKPYADSIKKNFEKTK